MLSRWMRVRHSPIPSGAKRRGERVSVVPRMTKRRYLGRHDFDEQDGKQAVAAGGAAAVPVRGEPGLHGAETVDAVGDDMQDRRLPPTGRNSADRLRGSVRDPASHDHPRRMKQQGWWARETSLASGRGIRETERQEKVAA
jgi:hypothetical protein